MKSLFGWLILLVVVVVWACAVNAEVIPCWLLSNRVPVLSDPFTKVLRSTHSFPVVSPADIVNPAIEHTTLIEIGQEYHSGIWPLIARGIVLTITVDADAVQFPSPGPFRPLIIPAESEKHIQDGLLQRPASKHSGLDVGDGVKVNHLTLIVIIDPVISAHEAMVAQQHGPRNTITAPADNLNLTPEGRTNL